MSKSKGRKLAEWLRGLDSNSRASSDGIKDSSISASKLEDDSVTNPKIADGAVHTANLADLNVTFDKLHTALVVTESDDISTNDNDSSIPTSAAVVDYVASQTLSGPKGNTGVQGPDGDTGLRGDTGPQGAAGADGDTGLRGDTGAQGAAGADGDTGPRGNTGVRGPDGDTGPEGDTGLRGDTGAQGATGPAGSPDTSAQVLTKIKTVDGSGSGLDADLLDGIQASSFLRSDADDTVSKQLTFPSSIHDRPILQGGFVSRLSSDGDADIWGISETYYPSQGGGNAWGIRWASSPNEIQFVGANANKLRIDLDSAGKVYIDNNEVWHAGNDGSGSGLDADLLDGQSSAYYAATSTNNIFTGTNTFDTNTNTVPLNISRTGSTAHQTLQIGVTDSQAIFNYIEDTTNEGAGAYGSYLFKVSGNESNSPTVTALTLDERGGFLNGALEITGDVTYNPSGGAGSDTSTGVGLALASGKGIVGYANGYIRNIITWTSGSAITIGQAGTVLINAINLLPGSTGTAQVNSNVIWHAGNDGSGSGLDADTVDGLNSTSFLRSDANDVTSGNLQVTGATNGGLSIGEANTNYDGWNRQLNVHGTGHARITVKTASVRMGIYAHDSWNGRLAGHVGTYTNHALQFITNGTHVGLLTTAGSLSTTAQGTLWGATNDGSGSGLDADTVDGLQASAFGRSNAAWTSAAAWKQTFHSGSGGATFGTSHYSMGVDVANGAWSGTNYSDLIIGYHTGIRLGAGYSGIRFYNNSPTTDTNNTGNGNGGEALLMTIGGGGSTTSGANVTINNDLYMGDNIHVTNQKGFVNSSSWTRNQTAYGYIDFGPANSGHAHIYTDRSNFYFNKTLISANGNTMWHAGNDGAGSGLDADTVDGLQASSFLRSDATDTTTGNIIIAKALPKLILDSPGSGDAFTSQGAQISLGESGDGGAAALHLTYRGDGNAYIGMGTLPATGIPPYSAIRFTYNSNNTRFLSTPNVNGSTVWHAGNDGSGSGLDADTLDGLTWASSGKNVRATEFYADNWFRNYNSGEGLYNQATTQHFYSDDDDGWNIAGGTAANWLKFRAEHNGTIQGWLYADTISQGFLNVAGGWQLRSRNASGQSPNWWFIEGSNVGWTGNPGNDEGKIEYHSDRFYIAAGANSNRICQFRRSGSDLSYIDNNGTFIGNISGSAGSVAWTNVSGRPTVGAGAAYLDLSTANYGTVKVDDDRGVTWAGYTIRDDWSLMSNGASVFGVYNDTDNEWMLYINRNGTTDLLHNGSTRIQSTSGGMLVSGTIDCTSQYAYTARNYGHGVFGVYSATRYQHVWSMGTAYKTNASGTSYGNMYGLTYTHTNIGTGTNQAISGLSHQLQHRTNGTLTAAIGSGIWTSGNVTAYSDIAVKENIVKIDNAIDKVKQINGYTYDRIDIKKQNEDLGEDTPTRQAGVIAQEIEKVLPEVVSGDDGNKAVAYWNVVALLIEAIKEQQDQIEELKEIINGSNI